MHPPVVDLPHTKHQQPAATTNINHLAQICIPHIHQVLIILGELMYRWMPSQTQKFTAKPASYLHCSKSRRHCRCRQKQQQHLHTQENHKQNVTAIYCMHARSIHIAEHVVFVAVYTAATTTTKSWRVRWGSCSRHMNWKIRFQMGNTMQFTAALPGWSDARLLYRFRRRVSCKAPLYIIIKRPRKNRVI